MNPTASKSLRVESFSKAQRLYSPSQDPNPSRSLVFETEKQRNVAFIQKGISKPGAISYTVLRRAAMSVHIARICINTLKEQITKTKWIVKPIDSQKEVDDEMQGRIDEVTELFKHPNQNDETFRTMLDKMLEDLYVLDAVSLEKTRMPDGTLAELHFVDSATIRPVFDEYGNQDVEIPLDTKEEGRVDLPVSYVQVANNSQYGGPESGEIIAAWPKKDFIYFHMHPQGAMEGIGYGLSPLEGVLSVVSNLLNADNYNGTYFEEGSFPPVIIQILGQVNQRDVEAYRQYLQSELMGNFHRPAIMAGGQEAKVLNLKDSTNRDMEFMEYMKFMARLLAAAYGLSGQDIGLTDDLNKAIADTQKDLSSRKGYASTLHLLKEVFNQEIIWKDFGYEELEFDWVADDMMDPKEQSDMNKSNLEAGIVTINEARTKLGFQPFEAWADKPMVLTVNGYVPILKSEGEDSNLPDDADESLKDEKGDVPSMKKKPDEKVDDGKTGNERNYKNQAQKPDKSVDAPVTRTRKSMFAQLWKRMTKSSNINFGNNPVVDISEIMRNNPSMFGELMLDQPLRDKVSKIFTDQDSVKIMKDFEVLMYTYHYNQAVESLFEYVRKNPKSYGGLLIAEDDRGVRYSVYIK